MATPSFPRRTTSAFLTPTTSIRITSGCPLTILTVSLHQKACRLHCKCDKSTERRVQQRAPPLRRRTKPRPPPLSAVVPHPNQHR
ncbi:hypothetical protein GN956_G8434 [Arapaima gigas]